MIERQKLMNQCTGHDFPSLREGRYNGQGIGDWLWKNEIRTVLLTESLRGGGRKERHGWELCLMTSCK